MRRRLIACFLVLLVLPPIWSEENTDMVVLLDNSVSVLPIYDDLENHLLGGILESHLASGDRFHLISFADVPEIEISREIRRQEEVEDILAYVQILQPMGQYTDLLLALMFLDTYVDDLSLITKKNILILTDGVHDPPPDSPFYGLSGEQVEQRIADFAGDLRAKGWDFHVLSFEGDAERQEKVSFLDSLTDNLGVVPVPYSGKEGDGLSHAALGIPRVTFPESLGEVGRQADLPLVVQNFNGEPRNITITGVLSAGANILRKPADLVLDKEEQGTVTLRLLLPEDMEPGEHSVDLTLITPKDVQLAPQKGTVKLVLIEGKGSGILWGRILLIILAAAAGIVILFFVVRFFSRGFDGGVHTAKPDFPAGGIPAGKGAPPALPAGPGTLPLEMMVTGQRRYAGAVNVIDVKEKGPVSIGGRGSSGFMIIIAPFPPEIAKIEYRNGGYDLSVIQEDHFPEHRGIIRNCIGKNIPLVSQNGKEIYIQFREWVSPLERINRILHLTDQPGLPDFDY